MKCDMGNTNKGDSESDDGDSESDDGHRVDIINSSGHKNSDNKNYGHRRRPDSSEVSYSPFVTILPRIIGCRFIFSVERM